MNNPQDQSNTESLIARPLAPAAAAGQLPVSLLEKLVERDRAFVVCACNAVFVADESESAHTLLARHRCPLAPADSAPTYRALSTGAIFIICVAVVLMTACITDALINS